MNIFTYDLTAVFHQAYLFTSNPGGFAFAGWAFALSVLGIGVSVFLNWYYKKRRSRWNLVLAKRKVVVKFARISIGFCSLYFLFVLLRLSELPVVSMRFFSYLLLLCALLNIVIALIFVAITKPAPEQVSSDTVGQDDYGKYLPRKKKK